jgi:hypothetical protein
MRLGKRIVSSGPTIAVRVLKKTDASESAGLGQFG